MHRAGEVAAGDEDRRADESYGDAAPLARGDIFILYRESVCGRG
jgi:hypothetical protein